MSGTASPQITVEVRGAGRCGKTVVAQLLRQVLRGERVTVIGPAGVEWLGRERLRQAVTDLKARGLAVEIVEVDTAGPIRPKHQIDARPGGRPLVEGLRGWAPGAAPPPGLPADDRAALWHLGFEAV